MFKRITLHNKRFKFGILCISILAALLISGSVSADDSLPPEPAPDGTQAAAEVSLIEPESESDQCTGGGEESLPEEEAPPEEVLPAEEEQETPSGSDQGTAWEADEEYAGEEEPVADLDPELDTDEEIPNDPSQEIESSEITETAAEPEETIVLDISSDSENQIEGTVDELLDRIETEDIEVSGGGDPYWKVGTQYYSVATTSGGCYPGTSVAAGTCWLNSSPISYALSRIDSLGLMPSDKKVYVLEGTYTGNITISGGGYLSQLNGLIGVDGSEKINIIGDITLENMMSGFTLSGFTINGGVEISDSVGNLVFNDLDISNPDGDGIRVTGTWYYYDEELEDYVEMEGPHYSGTITITDVNSSGNRGSGAYIGAVSTIKVTNSSFNSNGGTDGVDDPVDSLYIDSSWGNNATYVDGVVAKDNNGTGIWIEAGPVTVTNVIANNNTAPSYTSGEWKDYGHGVYVEGWSGTIKMENIIASENELMGIHADGSRINITAKNLEAIANGTLGIDFYTQRSVTLTGALSTNNGSSGLTIMAGGAVTLNSIVTDFNGYIGTQISTYTLWEYDSIADVWVDKGIIGPTKVTISSSKTGTWAVANSFSNNGYTGLEISSKGTVAISNADAYGNNGYGIQIDNCLFDNDLGVCQGSGNVTIDVSIPYWYNGVGENSAGGILIESKGNVILKDTSGVSNDVSGIWVTTWGTISLTNVEASNNSGVGTHLDNWIGLGKTVTITQGYFLENADTGLEIFSRGAVTINGIEASRNQSPTNGLLGTAPVTLFDSLTDGETWGIWGTGESVTIHLMTEGYDAGMELRDDHGGLLDGVYGSDDLTITYTLADGTYYEIWLWNDVSGEYGNFILSINDDDFQNPLYPGSGAVIDNSDAKANVTIKNPSTYSWNYFDDNDNFGLIIASMGSISLTNVAGSGNARSGVSLANPGSTGAVTIQDKTTDPQSHFNENGWEGVYVRTLGNIALNNISASGNGTSGLDLDNCIYDDGLGICLGKGSIKVGASKDLQVYFENNNHFGIWAQSKGLISLTNVQANGNGSDGALLYNNYPGSAAPVSVLVSGSAENGFSNNGWNDAYMPEDDYYIVMFNGLSVRSNGVITVKNAVANENYNAGGGLVLLNHHAASPKNVSVSNCTADGNDWVGTFILSRGNVLVKGLEADKNRAWNGLYIDNCQYDEGLDMCLGSGLVTLDSVSALENGGAGVTVFSKNHINLSSITTNGNGDYGVLASNRYNGATGNISLKGIYSEGNNNTGISISTNGTVTIKGADARENFLRYGYLEIGDAVSEYYNNDMGDDYWGFDAESGVTLTFRLNASDDPDWDRNSFIGSFSLYDENDNPVAFDTVTGGGTDALMATWTPSSSGYYYLAVSEQSGNNGFYRLSINNSSFLDMNYLFVCGMAIDAGKNVSFVGADSNYFGHNSLAGLSITTPGSVIITNTFSGYNGAEGLWLDNYLDGAGIGNVTFSGSNRSSFHGNGWEGISILTSGSVTIGKARATDNGGDGIRIGSDAERTAKPVTFKDIDVDGNDWIGIHVQSLGNVSLANVKAYRNGLDGVWVDNNTGFGNVVLSGENYFNDNSQSGLFVYTSGTVTLSGITANNNGIYGILVDKTGAGLVSMTNINVKYSGYHGISINTEGDIRLTGVCSLLNGVGSDGDGLHIEANPTGNVTIIKSTFMGNEGNGIDINNSFGVKPVLTAALYFGNDSDYDGTADQANYYWH